MLPCRDRQALTLFRRTLNADVGTLGLVKVRTSPAVVIPAYNSSEFLRGSVESALSQTLEALSVVVVDDGSTDGTVDLANQLAKEDRRITVCTQSNRGPAAARNRGFQQLSPSHDAVLFLDSDDVLRPQALEQLVAAFEKPGAVSGAYGLPLEMPRKGEAVEPAIQSAWGFDRREPAGWRQRKLRPGEPTGFGTFAKWNAIKTPGQALLRTAALHAVAGFRNVPAEDWDLWLRLTAAVGTFELVPEYVICKRDTPGSFGTRNHYLRRGERFIRESLSSPEYTPGQRRIARVSELHAAFVRFEWAASAVCDRRPRAAAAEVVRGSAGLARFAARWARAARINQPTDAPR